MTKSERGDGKFQRRVTGCYLRVRMPDGSRPLMLLGPPEMSDAKAAEAAAHWRENRDVMIARYLAARTQPQAPDSKSDLPTFREFGKKWTSGDLAKAHPDHVPTKGTAYDDDKRLEKHVYPKIGDKPLDAITLDDADDVMRGLPSDLSSSSRRHVAQLMARVLALAVYPARILKASPIPRGYLPKKGARKALAHLYPDEERRLLGKTSIPLCYRVLYGFLDREGMRAGEAAATTWADIDLDRGGVTLDENKTDDPRAWALGPDTRAALTGWREIRKRDGKKHVAPGAPVFVQEDGSPVNVDRGAERFRRHLQEAKIDRPELFERTTARRPIRLHDTRATFITVSLANGRSDTWVKDRTGHRSSQMVDAYRRTARKLAELDLGPLAPMDRAIPELAAAQGVGHERANGPQNSDRDVKPAKSQVASDSAVVHEERLELSSLAAPEPKAVSNVAARRISARSDDDGSVDDDVSRRLSAPVAHLVGHGGEHRNPDLERLGEAAQALADGWDALEAAVDATTDGDP